ncbi:GNAT family N-acetyltransferase [Chitinophaga sp. 22321]|uniref:GNAT family N-acetyltransferase n=1 Tax=Chitinophaga hostae TaxID=2831022 RepID=A0ABS5IRW6_9BACT|nr:GNAT family N-acetyltransferase [Chitinophaga hostae]MBS0025694.1 GNAT family N-acetyltransferase [Chitinophaga hostae]
MDTLNYRSAVAADAAAIRATSLQSYRQFEKVLSREYWEQMHHGMTDPGVLDELMSIAATFVCDTGSGLAGVVFLVPSGHPTPIYPANWAYIRRLGVDPAFRSMGVGRRLIELCIEQARINGEKILGLHTGTMMPEARRLYDRLGFSLIKELEPLLGQQYWLYSMDLSQ